MSAVAARSYGSLGRQVDAMRRRAADAGDVPGVVALASAGDSTIYEGAFGTRRLGSAKPMTIDTVVWIASMTKPVTSAAAMQLVEQGRVQLDEPAARWAPELGAVQVLEGFDAASAPQLRPPKRPITLRHLLTHTSGYGYGMWNAPIARYMELLKLPGIASCGNAALRLPLLFDPGERWNYGINIEFWIDPAGNAGGLYLTQILPFADAKSLPLFLDFETAVCRSL